MAGAARSPKLTLVGIIFGVAGVTIAGQAGKIGTGVALGTSQLEMGTGEWKFRCRVIETSGQPGVGGVTGATRRPKLPIVSIIFSMARKSVRRQTGKDSIDVALGTSQLEMGA